jgi:hypothetical protein
MSSANHPFGSRYKFSGKCKADSIDCSWVNGKAPTTCTKNITLLKSTTCTVTDAYIIFENKDLVQTNVEFRI